MSLLDDIRESELKGMLAEIDRRYKKEAEPIITELAKIYSRCPMPPIIISVEDIPESIREIAMRMDK